MPFPLSRSRKKPRPDEPFSLEGKKVVLREKRIEDALVDYTWRVDEELARLDATHPLNMVYNDFLRYSQEEIDYPNSRSKRFAIDDLTGKHIGNSMFYDMDKRRRQAELGIMIGDRAYWSKGYGTDAVNIMLKYIFTQANMKRIYLHTLDWNARAQKSFGKSGFQRVKRVRRRGLDFIQMDILRDDWERMHYPSEGSHR